jgi:aryl-alcohol dehydrogenase-like predicted oxidoreductase
VTTTPAPPASAGTDRPVHASGTFRIGGELEVHRLGYGGMRILGPWAWGPPEDPAAAVATVRRAVELGVDLIDTADAYGPFISEDLIAEALRGLGRDAEHVVVATKGGQTRSGWDKWEPVGRPEYLRQCLHMSLRRLGLDRIGLYQLHRVDEHVPLEDQVGALEEMRQAGLIAHIGLSEVDLPTIEAARKVAPIATVQNLFNLGNRYSEDVLEYCEREGIAFIPWFPMAMGKLAGPESPLTRIAAETSATPAQLALAWLLARSPNVLPIPGTGSVAHVEENCRAAQVRLSAEQVAELTAAVPDVPRPGR